jgi:hypothetical protein
MTDDTENFPLLEIEETALRVVNSGGFIYQKWTCGGCGARITGNKKNFLAIQGHCEKCDYTTDLLVTGCNYVAFIPLGAKDAL